LKEKSKISGVPGILVPVRQTYCCAWIHQRSHFQLGFYDSRSIRIKSGAQRREAILTGSLCMGM